MCFNIFSNGILKNLCLESSHTSLFESIYIHVPRFVVHFRVWTNIDAMCSQRRLRFLSLFQWTCSTRSRIRFIHHSHLKNLKNRGRMQKKNCKKKIFFFLQKRRKRERKLFVGLLLGTWTRERITIIFWLQGILNFVQLEIRKWWTKSNTLMIYQHTLISAL